MFKRKRTDIKLDGKTIRLSAEIDMSVDPNETRVQPNTGDPWIDFGFWLEAVSFMAYQAMRAQGWNEKQIKAYIHDYLDKTLNTYTIKK